MGAQRLRGYLFVIASAVIFGSMPLMARHIYADGVNSISLVLFRNILSLPMLALAAVLSGKSLKVNIAAIPSMTFIGMLGCAITPLLLFSSYNYVASGTATVFHFVYPAVVVLFEIVFMKSRARLGSIVSLALCILGICTFYTPGEAISPLGSSLALLSGVTYALYIVFLGKFKYKEISGFVFSFYVSLISSVIMLIVCLCSGELCFPESFGGWVLTALFAMAVNVGAVVLFQRGTFIVGGERASILSTFEPITSIIVGAIFFDEEIIWRTVLGALLVISASALIAVLDMRGGKDDLRKGEEER